MKLTPRPVVFFPRNPIVATIAVAVAMLVLRSPKKLQDVFLVAIRAVRFNRARKHVLAKHGEVLKKLSTNLGE